jgi:hypothetical protein
MQAVFTSLSGQRGTYIQFHLRLLKLLRLEALTRDVP